MSNEKSEGQVVINTKLRNDNLINGYKNISKETDKLIKQYNKKVDQIQKEEIALDNLKAKYNQLASGNKAPASLTAMESQLKKCEKEVSNLEKQYNDVINKMATNQIDLEFAKGTGDTKQISLLNGQQAQLDNQSILLATQLEDARDKSEKLKQSLNELKVNPQSSAEAQNLKAKIDLTEQSINNSKQEANDLVSKIKKANTIGYDSLTNSVNKLGSSILSHITGKNGLSGGLDKISSKLDKFKRRITGLISTAMIFSLLRKGLTSLSSGFTSLLKSNDTFSTSLNQIKANLVTAFAPIYNYALPAINTLMSALSKLTGTIATFTASLFGQTAEQAKKNAEALYEQANAQNAVNEQESLGSFDKLEVNKEESSGSANTGIDFSGMTEVNSKLLDYLNELKELISSGEWYEVGAKLADSLNNTLANFDVKGFFEKGQQLASNLAQGINGFITTFDWNQLGQKISDGIKGAIKTITTFISELDWNEVGTSIKKFLLGIDWLGIGKEIVNLIGEGLLSIDDFLMGLFGNEDIVTLIEALALAIGGITAALTIYNTVAPIAIALTQFLTSPIGAITLAITALIAVILLCIKHWDDIKEAASKCWELIVSVWNGAKQWFLDTIVQPIIDLFTGLFEGLVNGALLAWEGIKIVFSGLADFFGNIFSTAWEKVKAVFSTGGKIFDGIKDGIINAFKAVVNTLIKGINTVVAMPFKGLNTILQKIHDISFLGITPFTWLTWRAPIPQMPMLAEGAVIPPNKKFTAVLGDQRNGTNLEAPENLIRKIVREESGGTQEIYLKNATFVIQLKNGVELGRTVIDSIRLVEDMDGTPYLV